MKFNNAISNDEDKKLGLMYFLLGMGLVSRECYDTPVDYTRSILNTRKKLFKEIDIILYHNKCGKRIKIKNRK